MRIQTRQGVLAMPTQQDPDELATFAVFWHDYVANEWTAVIRGPYARTRDALNHHIERGEREGHFSMTYARLDTATLESAEAFFSRDWNWRPDGHNHLDYVTYTDELPICGSCGLALEQAGDAVVVPQSPSIYDSAADVAHNRGDHDGRESQFADVCPTCHFAITGKELGS